MHYVYTNGYTEMLELEHYASLFLQSRHYCRSRDIFRFWQQKLQTVPWTFCSINANTNLMTIDCPVLDVRSDSNRLANILPSEPPLTIDIQPYGCSSDSLLILCLAVIHPRISDHRWGDPQRCRALVTTGAGLDMRCACLKCCLSSGETWVSEAVLCFCVTNWL